MRRSEQAGDIAQAPQSAGGFGAAAEFHAAFETAPIGMALFDMDGRFVRTNPALRELLGYADEDLFGLPFTEVAPSGDPVADFALYRELVRGERSRYQMEQRFVRKDGGEIWTRLTAAVAHDAEGLPSWVIGIVEDITERRRIAEALSVSETRFRAVIEQSPLSIHIFAPDGHSLVTNGAWDELWFLDEGEEHEGANILRDPQIRTAGLVPYLERGIAGESVTTPPLLYDPSRVGHQGHARWLQGVVYPVEDEIGAVREVVLIESDITERVRVEESLKRSEQRFRSLVQNASDSITLVDPDGAVLYQSPALHRILGYEAGEVVGTSVFERVHPDDLEETRRALSEIADGSGSVPPLQIRLRHRDGSWRYLEVVGSNMLDDPSVGGIVLNARDITERRGYEERLQYQAFHDSLTGLPNRALFLDRLGRALLPSSRGRGAFAVLVLDLNRFKLVNESLGHGAGDQLLAAVGERVGRRLRPEDTLARLGGDEYGILIEDAGGAGGAVRAAEAVADQFTAPFLVEGQEVFLQPTIGIVVRERGRYPDGAPPQELLRDAGVALRRAKGRSSYEFFDTSTAEHALERLRTEADLRHAIERGQLRLFYQPKVEIATGEVRAAEALMRWEHPDRGLLPPGVFIGLAEETGLILPMGEWALEEACRQARAWAEGHPAAAGFTVSVNLSARQFEQPGLADQVARALRLSGLPAERLCLEITESVLMEDAESTIAVLRALKALGVQLAMDDFGTGYSSLSYLRHFPVDELKVDRSFVAGLGANRPDTAIVESVVLLAHTLGMRVTAEGVELPDQLAILRDLRCETAQGYLFSRPVSAEVLGELLVRGYPTDESATTAPTHAVDDPALLS